MGADYFTFIFVLGLIQSFWDSFGIGANDVANSFSTAVASKTLKLWQACAIASVTEFLGAFLLGAHVTDTIKNKVVQPSDYADNPSTLMLGMLCSLYGSSICVIGASKLGLPVSTTHATVGAIIGFGIAAHGSESINWAYSNKGVWFIAAGWVYAPLVAGACAATIFLLIKYGLFRRADPYKWTIRSIPFIFALTAAIETLFIVWKGSPRLNLDDQEPWKIAVECVSIGLAFGAFGILCFVPWADRKVKGKEPLRSYEMFYHWCIPTREPVAEALEPEEGGDVLDGGDMKAADEATPDKGYFAGFKKKATKGLLAEVADYKAEDATIKEMHDLAEKFDEDAEELFRFLQVMTSSLASFAHGANDVANAIGPLSTIYYIWQNAEIPPKKVQVELWILAYGGIGIDVGLILYGYKIMRALGNQITYHSPSRGFSMELGATLSVMIASKTGIPVSTTQCITGATLFVGLCNGNLKTLGWKRLAITAFGWVLTLPVAGLISGLVFAFAAYSPSMLEGTYNPSS
mmetsp:Transcript_21863/g.54007  ORF Transcript_21863/g.54007 Transcript_21863/m.54007 type:complete len:519 (-) Transcript_21863:166-1722(-)